MAGEANVGSIIGYLRLDRSDWDNELRAAAAKADELGRSNPNIKIGTNAPSAIAQLAAVAAAVKRLQDAQGAELVAEQRLVDLRTRGNNSPGKLAQAEEAITKARRAQALAVINLAAANDKLARAQNDASGSTDKFANSANNAHRRTRLLLQTLLLLAPAMVPLGGVLVGALAGAVPVVGTLALGIKDISDEAKSGALANGQYAQSFAVIKSEAKDLKKIAGGGLLDGLNRAVKESAPGFADLNRDTAIMSQQLGDITAAAIPALLRIMHALNPLFETFGQILTGGAQKLDHWSQSSDGVAKFVAYVQKELPTVIAFLGAMGRALAHIAEAAAPVGHAMLLVLTAIANIVDKIPTQVLTDLVAAFVSLFVIGKVVGLLTMFGAALTGAGGPAGAFVALLAITAVLIHQAGQTISNYTEKHNALTQVMKHAGDNQRDWAAALRESKGVVDDNVKAVAVATLSSDGLAHAVNRAGVSLVQLTDAFTGSDASFGHLLKQLKDSGKLTAEQQVALGVLHGKFKQTEQAARDMAEAEQILLTAEQGGTAAVQLKSRALGVNTDQYLSLAKAVDAQRSSAKLSAIQSDLEAEALARVGTVLGHHLVRGFDAASLSGSKFDAALKTFSQSAGTAEDHAALLGAGLVAMQGDALGVASALAGASSANFSLVDAFKQQARELASQTAAQDASANAAVRAGRSADSAAGRVVAAEARLDGVRSRKGHTAAQLASAEAGLNSARNSAANAADRLGSAESKAGKAGALAYEQTERAALKFTRTQKGVLKATIDTSKEGAAPLVQQLIAMQDAAEKAAEAVYQHEVKTKGMAKATEDAANIFKTDTYDALIKDHDAMGLNIEEATALADTYFNMPKDFSTKAKLLGTADVVNVLDKIGQQLSYLTKHPWVSTVAVDGVGPAITQLDRLRNALTTTAGGQIVEVKFKSGAIERAAGGYVSGAGSGTSDSIAAMLSNGEYVVNAQDTARNLPLLEQINRGGSPGLSMPGHAVGGYVNRPAEKIGAAAAASGAALIVHGDLSFPVINPAPEQQSDSVPIQARRAVATIGRGLRR